MIEGQMERVNYINRWCTISVIEKTLNYFINSTVNFVFNVAFLLLLIIYCFSGLYCFSVPLDWVSRSPLYIEKDTHSYTVLLISIRRIPFCHISILYFNCFQAMIVLLFVGHSETGWIILKRILAKKYVMMWSGSMIVMFSFLAKSRLCDRGVLLKTILVSPKNSTHSFKKSTLLKSSSSQTFIRMYQWEERMWKVWSTYWSNWTLFLQDCFNFQVRCENYHSWCGG
jgi:hypothetical protein